MGKIKPEDFLLHYFSGWSTNKGSSELLVLLVNLAAINYVLID